MCRRCVPVLLVPDVSTDPNAVIFKGEADLEQLVGLVGPLHAGGLLI